MRKKKRKRDEKRESNDLDVEMLDGIGTKGTTFFILFPGFMYSSLQLAPVPRLLLWSSNGRPKNQNTP